MFWVLKYLLPIFAMSAPILAAPILAAPIPIVVLHGLESSSIKMEPFCDWLAISFNTKIFNLEIGNGEKTSLYTPLTIQLDELCDIIYSNDELEEGFNFIGMSQGGLLARGYIERCNEYPVINLITLVSPHGGEFIESININMYSDFFQYHLSVAGYWRNPLELTNYFYKCRYLPILNNEIETEFSKHQSSQIMSLNNFIMIWSPFDSVLSPPESGKFSFYDDSLNVIELKNTEIYISLGLKYLDDNKRLHMYQTNCSHVDHRNEICYSQLYQFLKLFL
jgi:palmitoyl-protein thioesterase